MEREKENPIKLPVSITAIVACLVLVIYCVVLWHKVDNEREKLTDMCRYSITNVCDSFESFERSGLDSDYLSALGDYRAFMQAYLTKLGTSDGNYLELNRLYGSMTIKPDSVKEHLPELMEALEYLENDYTDQNGYLRIMELNNELENGDQ